MTVTVHLIACHWWMAVFTGIVSAFLTLPISMVCSWLLLDMKVQSWEATLRGRARLPEFENRAQRERALILYAIPLALASVGYATGFHLCISGVI